MEKTPNDQKIFVLRDHESSILTKASLSKLGFNPISIPLVSYQVTASTKVLSQVLKAYKPEMILLASERACSYFFELCRKLQLNSDYDFVVVGERAEKFLRAQGLNVVISCQKFLDLQFAKIKPEQRILYPSSRERNSQELEMLRKKDLEIKDIELYAVNFLGMQKELILALKESPNLPILVYSSSQAKALSNYPAFQAQIFCLGERTFHSLQSLGFKKVLVSPQANEESLLEIGRAHV